MGELAMFSYVFGSGLTEIKSQSYRGLKAWGDMKKPLRPLEGLGKSAIGLAKLL